MRNLVLLLALAACQATAPTKPAPSPAPSPAPDPVLDEAMWRAEAEQILFDRLLENAKRYSDAGELEKALESMDQALALRPGSEEARDVRRRLQKEVGVRAGEAETMLEDEWLAMQAREEQRVVEAQRLLNEAREAEESGDHELAANLYKRAAFLAKQK